MEKIKVDSVAEYKLYQKVIDATKKIVNIVGIFSFVYGMIAASFIVNVAINYQDRPNGAVALYLVLGVFVIVYALLLFIVNRGLNKYKDVE